MVEHALAARQSSVVRADAAGGRAATAQADNPGTAPADVTGSALTKNSDTAPADNTATAPTANPGTALAGDADTSAADDSGMSTAGLAHLVPLLAKDPAFLKLLGRHSASLALLEAGRAAALAGLSAASRRSPLYVVTATRTEAERLTADLGCFLGPQQVEELPAWETLPFERVSPSVATMGRRCRVLHRLQHPERLPAVVVSSARALAQRVDLSCVAEPIVVELAGAVDQAELISDLVAFGYRREHQVEHVGEFAVRGSIVDVFGSTAAMPVRIDLWGDEVDRLTSFSVGDQRAADPLARAEFYPAREVRPDAAMRQRAAELVGSHPWGRAHWERIANGELFEGMESWWPWLVENPGVVPDLLPVDAAVVLVEPQRIAQRIADLLAEEQDLAATLAQTWGTEASGMAHLHADMDELLKGTGRSGRSDSPEGSEVSEGAGTQGSDESGSPLTDAPVWLLPSLPRSPSEPVMAVSGWERLTGSLEPRVRRISDLLADGYKVLLCGSSAGTARRLSDLLAEEGVRIEPVTAALSRGAVFRDLKLALVSESDITGRRTAHRKPRARSRDQRRFFDDLEVGGFVVHEHHGVARFEGMVQRVVGGHEREYLLLAFRGTDRLYVPADQVETVRHYTGGDSPTLSRMGGADWSAAKARVRSAVSEVAQELVVLYQTRMATSGWACGPDSPWQRELEDSFEFTETRDQLQALADVKSDLERPVPMDRLVVGDVGFGKTEIALRAAFKVVQSNRQVAILVPTTLLAQQHTQTLRERYAPFGVRVEMLSRFLTPGQARKVVRGVASGEVDVVVGTHRLLSSDVTFKRLGLLVIDEEQRFGVRHKEAIKALRADIDVLTLTATPVPRTLEMSLTGIRDMSLLQTPPADRKPILTYVGEDAERPVAEAIRRELLRDGQVFYVHNRVADIEHVADRVRSLVPEARVAVAHGQMDEAVLEQSVLDFGEHRYDVLVCTTIIESGIDMPTVNTLVVTRADRLGLGQLHQIRGRVGRSGRRAYAYLFHPVDQALSEEAYERLKTIGEATELGSGYRIAMRDLEIRGAGNLLGDAQSGHIAAVGYDLYCRLVLEAVAELRGETVAEPSQVKIEVPVNAHIPADYMTREASRLEAYRRLAAVTDVAEVNDVRAEWNDRFGALPASAEALLAIGRLRCECLRVRVSELIVTRRGSGLSAVRYMAQLAPVRLTASRQARLRRLYGKDAYCNGSTSELYVPLSEKDGPILDQLLELLEQVCAPVPGADASVGAL